MPNVLHIFNIIKIAAIISEKLKSSSKKNKKEKNQNNN